MNDEDDQNLKNVLRLVCQEIMKKKQNKVTKLPIPITRVDKLLIFHIRRTCHWIMFQARGDIAFRNPKDSVLHCEGGLVFDPHQGLEGCRFSWKVDHANVNLIELRKSLVHLDAAEFSWSQFILQTDLSKCPFRAIRVLPSLPPPSLMTSPLSLPLFAEGLDTLILPDDFGPVDHLPSTLKSLILKKNFNHPVDHLPCHLEKLIFNLDLFNQRVDYLPVTLTHLVLGGQFNQPLDYLPAGLIQLSLRMSRLFNQPIDHLPPLLELLRLSNSFNQPVDHLPAGLKQLGLGIMFDQPIDHLPPGLTFLGFPEGHDSRFNQPVDHLPPGLINLCLSCQFEQSIDHLPSTLQRLRLGPAFDRSVDHLPAGLMELVIEDYCGPVDHLPISLRRLRLVGDFDQYLDHLPASLQCLSIGYAFHHVLDHLPSQLQFLHFEEGSHLEGPLDHLPSELAHLDIPAEFNHPLHKLPVLLKTLVLQGNIPEYPFLIEFTPLPPPLILEEGFCFPEQLTSLSWFREYPDEPVTLPPSLLFLTL